MDQGYKHFIHLHKLVMHQMPDGLEVPCSCCHFSASGTVYVCWQCKFFLHDQCFRATRSLKHPLHAPHPLTLLPYPTYASSSFYCDSCKITGTGFSYSCAECEFDLHLRCAYNSNPFIHAQNLPYTPQHSISHVNHFTAHDQAYAHGSSSAQIGLKDRKDITHFNHPHNLSILNLKENRVNEVVCSGCEDTLVGNGYSCTEPNCNFHLHESCFHLKREIKHKSHPEHPLNLLPSPLSYYQSSEFQCNACLSNGSGFTYHCSICHFDLHIQCASLPGKVKRADHEHAMKLLYSHPQKDGTTTTCDVCYGVVKKNSWVYHCCNFDTHVGCVGSKKCERDSVIDTQVQIEKPKPEKGKNKKLGQAIVGIGVNIASSLLLG